MHNSRGDGMDIMLERMLSLIPKKENGKYVHGAKKEFCEAIGAPTNIVSEWEAGKTKSYRNYLYVVSAKYNVSVEWLKGETDDPSAGIKKGPIQKDEADEMDAELVAIWNDSDETDRKLLLDMARAIKLRRENK